MVLPLERIAIVTTVAAGIRVFLFTFLPRVECVRTWSAAKIPESLTGFSRSIVEPTERDDSTVSSYSQRLYNAHRHEISGASLFTGNLSRIRQRVIIEQYLLGVVDCVEGCRTVEKVKTEAIRPRRGAVQSRTT